MYNRCRLINSAFVSQARFWEDYYGGAYNYSAYG